MKRLYPGAIAALTALAAPALVWADGAHQGAGEVGHMWGGGWGWMVGGPLMMILFVALIVALVVLVVRWLGGVGGGTARGPREKTPLDILEERFARGEIEREEFEQRRQTLRG
ncbi:MAG: SHOCT domain-containing protein [Kiloniellales bacterium]|jgi:putative membrane protein